MVDPPVNESGWFVKVMVIGWFRDSWFPVFDPSVPMIRFAQVGGFERR
jgi:hypothetical protein